MASPSTASVSHTPAKLAELRQAGKQVARSVGGSTVKEYFEANKDALTALMPEFMKRNPNRMVTLALNCLRTTPKLMDCTLDSLFRAIIICAQFGLEPNTPQGHIYLIPFENRRKKVVEVQIILGYKGLIDLARRSGEIETITARVAYKGDDFSIEYGTVDAIKHIPKLDGEPGAIIGVYAVAKLKGGGYQFEWMSVAQINKIRDESQGYKTAKAFGRTNTPWHTNWEEMAKKTAIRRLCKYLPMSIEMANAMALDARGDAGKQQVELVEGEFTILPEEAEDGAEDVTDQEEGGQSAANDQASGAGPAQIEQKTELPMTNAAASQQQAESAPVSRPPAKKTTSPRSAPPQQHAEPPVDDQIPDPPADDDRDDTGPANLFDE